MWPCSVGHKVFKAVRVVTCQGTLHLLRQHLSLWHTHRHTNKMTLFGYKYRFSVPSVSNLQHLSFLVHSVKVHGCSRWELIPEFTSWHSSCVLVYPPGTFAYISIQLPRIIIFNIFSLHTKKHLVKTGPIIPQNSADRLKCCSPSFMITLLIVLFFIKMNHSAAFFKNVFRQFLLNLELSITWRFFSNVPGLNQIQLNILYIGH